MEPPPPATRRVAPPSPNPRIQFWLQPKGWTASILSSLDAPALTYTRRNSLSRCRRADRIYPGQQRFKPRDGASSTALLDPQRASASPIFSSGWQLTLPSRAAARKRWASKQRRRAGETPRANGPQRASGNTNSGR